MTIKCNCYEPSRRHGGAEAQHDGWNEAFSVMRPQIVQLGIQCNSGRKECSIHAATDPDKQWRSSLTGSGLRWMRGKNRIRAMSSGQQLAVIEANKAKAQPHSQELKAGRPMMSRQPITMIPDGETGRRAGLLIRCPQGRAGSKPALGATKQPHWISEHGTAGRRRRAGNHGHVAERICTCLSSKVV